MAPPLGGGSGQFLGRCSCRASAKLLGGVPGRVFAPFSGRVLPGFAGRDSGEVLPRFLGTASGRFSPKLIGEFPGRLLARLLAGHFAMFPVRFFGRFSGHASATFRRRLDLGQRKSILLPQWERPRPTPSNVWLTTSTRTARPALLVLTVA